MRGLQPGVALPEALELEQCQPHMLYDHIWTEEEPLMISTVMAESPPAEGASPPQGETSTHVTVHTLFLSGLKQKYRQFLRQSDGAIVEVVGDVDLEQRPRSELPGQTSAKQQLRKRKNVFGRARRVEPVRGGCGTSFALQDLS
uniref:Uncharacterized protein n=1 Tax=Knipowitschia caucasica TaxID=637954 RepID=A0AAV2L6I5_KNICA